MVFANKKIFKSLEGEIHVGNNAPENFSETNLDDLKEFLKDLGEKKVFRCHVCNDLHIGIKAPETCPTCFVEDAYIEINLNEFKTLMEING